ncbi:MAG: hypothetical protein ACI8S6_001872 [Myxococcota bacterium]|jgi:hypothetical protein
MTRMFYWIGLPLVGLAGCDDAVLPDLTDWQAGYESDTDTGFVDTTQDVGFGLIVPFDIGYDVRLQQTSIAEDCIVDVPGTFANYTAIDCTYDISELDLYGSGLTFEVFVPPNTCDYLIYDFYMYEAWETGLGSTDVSYTINTDGEIVDPVNYVDGTPYCPYDYSRIGSNFPNCCEGAYTLTINDEIAGVKTSETKSWAGRLSECYDGAAFAYPGYAEGPGGFPLATLVPLYGDSYSERFEWGAISDRYATNLALANYYDESDHDGGPPAGLRKTRAQPYYSFRCYDSGEELLSKVELVVREWNEESEFLLDGDPNTTGVEVVSGEPIDDRADWATATPGSDTYIEDND